jgi:HD-GYP domain-containing protein (c-di-GMP phosphodiesterase class II)
MLPPALVHKPGALTDAELAVMRAHPTLGRLILMQAGEEFAHLAELVEGHHERWDGQGYPHGLARSDIPLVARILAVVDAFDAMTVTRPYHQASPVTAAQEELQRCAGSRYDPSVVTAFACAIAALEREGIAIPFALCALDETRQGQIEPP